MYQQELKTHQSKQTTNGNERKLKTFNAENVALID